MQKQCQTHLNIMSDYFSLLFQCRFLLGRQHAHGLSLLLRASTPRSNCSCRLACDPPCSWLCQTPLEHWQTHSSWAPPPRWPPSLQRPPLPPQVSGMDRGMPQRASVQDSAHSLCCSVLRVLLQRLLPSASVSAYGWTQQANSSACCPHVGFSSLQSSLAVVYEPLTYGRSKYP